MRLGARAYSPSRFADVYRHLRERAATALRVGRTVIADATFLDPTERESIEDLALGLGVPFQGIWLDAPIQVLERRIQSRTGDASDADVSVLAKQRNRDIGAMTWNVVDAGDSAADVALAIQLMISK